jgi:hypothetical protein
MQRSVNIERGGSYSNRCGINGYSIICGVSMEKVRRIMQTSSQDSQPQTFESVNLTTEGKLQYCLKVRAPFHRLQ